MKGSAERSADGTAPGPGVVYSRELKGLRELQEKEQRRDRALGWAKLGMAGVIVALAVVLLREPGWMWVEAVPVAGFAALAGMHDKVIRAVKSRERTIAFYERGMARLEGRWVGMGETGERFLEAAHPYARDLNIFGDGLGRREGESAGRNPGHSQVAGHVQEPVTGQMQAQGEGSIFELLSTARTRAGEETLARWLLQAADREEIKARQEAVEELRGGVKFREKLAGLGETVRAGVHPEALAAWGERKHWAGTAGVKAWTTGLALVWVGSLAAWGLWGWRGFALGMTLVNLGYSHHLETRMEEAAEAVESAAKDLELLAGVLELMEGAEWKAAKLVELQGRLRREGMKASEAVKRLGGIVQALESRRNPFAKVLDVLTFWGAQTIFRAEAWQRSFGPSIRGWVEAVGELEALESLAGYAYEHPEDVFPEMVEGGPVFEAEGFAHPLLADGKAVRNDLKLGDGLQLMILSGPNMAGKSTFIRSVGVNAVLAQCGGTVRARRLRMSGLEVAASICVLDSLTGGMSRFYAEISRVKVIAELARGSRPVLFLLDELLSGTNSHDRLAGTEYVVESLLAAGAVGIVSTHDLALAKIPERLGAKAVNCHFEDRIEAGRLIFDYRLKPGVVKTSNALELMRSIGLGVAEESAEERGRGEAESG